MTFSSDRISRGKRVQEIQRLCGQENDNMAFTQLLNAAAKELGLPEAWNPNRLAKIRHGTQDLSINDTTVLAKVDPAKRGWMYAPYGIVLSKGEDAWTALARAARRSA